jgi:circadian clock protein KaiC
MPEENFLVLQVHELLAYLGQQGVITILVFGQHGFVGESISDVDLSYLSDMLLRYFEHKGQPRKTLAVVTARTSDHERTIGELKIRLLCK